MKFDEIHIIPDYILILGSGKYGQKALDFATKKKYRNILIIDKKTPSNLERNIHHIREKKELNEIIRNLSKDKMICSENEDVKNNILFYESEIEDIFDILMIAIPEFIIPVVPIHFAAKIIQFFNSNLESTKLNLSHQIDITIFDKISHFLPDNIILYRDLELGMILLSWAQLTEICPDNCIGPLDFCPHFKRKKDKTITDYLNEISKMNSNENINIIHLLFKSKQLIGGLGGISGNNFLKNLKIFEKLVFNYTKNRKSRERENILAISTSCNCHGVINFFKF